MTREQAKDFINDISFGMGTMAMDHWSEKTGEKLREALEALERQEDDAISRQAVVSRISDLLMIELKGERLPTWNEVYRAIGELPSVQPKQKTGEWIPVSERLPLLRGSYKISDDVLITNGFEIDMGYLVERKGKIFWHYYGGEYEFGIKDEDNDATAWMPLPEPYKEERSDKE